MMTQQRGFRPIAGIEFIGGEIHFHEAKHTWPYDCSEGQYEFDISKCMLSEPTIRMIAQKMAEDLLPETVCVEEWQVEFDGFRVKVAPELWSWV